MTRRLLVLALGFGISAAPLAVTLCQVLCADAPSMTAQQHSCHADAASASPNPDARVPHGCGHGTESPEGVEGSAPSPTAFVAVVPAGRLDRAGAVRRACRPRVPSTAAPRPVRSPPITQLRV